MEPDTYVAFYNDIWRTINAGDQVYYFYGQRSNMFLLLNYGFAIEDNKYDSYTFYVNMALNKIMDVNLPEWLDKWKTLPTVEM